MSDKNKPKTQGMGMDGWKPVKAPAEKINEGFQPAKTQAKPQQLVTPPKKP